MVAFAVLSGTFKSCKNQSTQNAEFCCNGSDAHFAEEFGFFLGIKSSEQPATFDAVFT
jgi:hypothetical protein